MVTQLFHPITFIRNFSLVFPRRYCTTAALGPTSLSAFTSAMADAVQEQKVEKNIDRENRKGNRYKSRYDGRTKKRNWQDYTAEGSAEKRACFNPEDRVKKRKSLLLLGYSGVNYFGMQRNPDTKTIEEDLLTALFKNKWISEDGFKQAQNIQFQRAARTDKGVSAARQCVSLKLPDEIDLTTLNNDLPPQIRVFCIKRVTKGFNSKEQCDYRTYTYTLPTLSFAAHDEPVQITSYRSTSDKIDEVNRLLKMYEGTKNFHNFTSKKEFMDPSSKRFIMSFKCDQPFLKDGCEFAVLRVRGQSFMLHQIRKMVGLVLAVVRGLTTADTISRSFTEARIDIPMAPGLGLVLDQVHYDRYNERYAEDGIHEALLWTSEEPTIQAFIDEFIYPTIVNTEINEKSMESWLETLPIHSYDVRPSEQMKRAEDSTTVSTEDLPPVVTDEQKLIVNEN